MQGLKHFNIPFNLENEESRYWLGYICADGNVYAKKGNYTVSLFSKDIDIINKFMNFIGSRAKYHKRKQNGVHQAYVASMQLCEYLKTLNILPNKGLSLNPYIIFDKDFLRGYFDGDGSIRKRLNECKITCGSKIFIDRLSNHLNTLNIYHKIRPKGNAYDICIERKSEAKKFLDYLYEDSTIYLDRKYQLYEAFVSNYK